MAKTDLITRFLIWRLRHLSNKNFVLILSGVIGILAGLAAVILKTAVHAIQKFLTQSFYEDYANFFYIIYPVIGIGLAYAIGNYILKDIGGHGIPDLLYNIAKKSSIIPRVKMYSRVVTSAITVGFGGSVGLEAPIVVTGSAIGSNFGSLMHLSAKKRTLLIGCGAAGAISAIFGAPIGAVIFAIEVILLELSVGSFIPLLIASVTGSITSMLLLGEDVMFSFNLSDEFLAGHMPYYFLLAMVTGIISLYFSRVVLRTEALLDMMKDPWVKLLYGGAFLGLIVFFFPPIYGEGYDTLNALIDGEPQRVLQRSPFFAEIDNPYFIIIFLMLVVLIKPIASAITIGSGGSGGIFAPSLFVGGIVGFVFAYAANLFGVPMALPIAHFTLVAMCGVMSGVQHAPLSAIFLIAEVTGGYELFLPLMLVSAISFVTTTYFDKDSLYIKQLKGTGRYLFESKDEEVLDTINIRKIMETDLLTIQPDSSLKDLCGLVQLSKRNIFPVISQSDELMGIITLDDIRDIMFDAEKQESVKISQLMHSPPDIILPNESMQHVMDKFEKSGAWNLPVVEDGVYLGFISKSRIFNAYRKRLQRQNQD
ncbi:chloride channel protein, CIC family [Belliella buryatensis]|uniref:Chloride channel protein, CIC family n=1 Tax=Belliella buryatensis TaxID=1500549 RepID=A0A239BVS1_9BACT|nr:chloride channel protein [Belliella buryatensis]SNS12135.1 chloride channel protein, CIC family [Belliella buryatensis]